MLWKHAARGDEKAFGTYNNVEASSLTTGYAVAYATASASFNGTNVCLASSGSAGRQYGFIGIAAQDIAPNVFGIVQTHGAVASVWLSNNGSSLTINVGDPLVPGAAVGGLFSAAPTAANSGFCFVLASNVPVTTSATGYLSGVIRHGI